MKQTGIEHAEITRTEVCDCVRHFKDLVVAAMQYC